MITTGHPPNPVLVYLLNLIQNKNLTKPDYLSDEVYIANSGQVRRQRAGQVDPTKYINIYTKKIPSNFVRQPLPPLGHSRRNLLIESAV